MFRTDPTCAKGEVLVFSQKEELRSGRPHERGRNARRDARSKGNRAGVFRHLVTPSAVPENADLPRSRHRFAPAAHRCRNLLAVKAFREVSPRYCREQPRMSGKTKIKGRKESQRYWLTFKAKQMRKPLLCEMIRKHDLV